MASALAAQLQVLSSAAPREETKIHGKASLLYEPREAADIDTHTIYTVGLAGE